MYIYIYIYIYIIIIIIIVILLLYYYYLNPYFLHCHIIIQCTTELHLTYPLDITTSQASMTNHMDVR